MSLRALLYAYVLGGLTFVPLLILAFVCITVYTSIPVPDPTKNANQHPPQRTDHDRSKSLSDSSTEVSTDVNDLPCTRKGWLTVRHTFEDHPSDGSYVTFVKSYLDSRSKDPKRSRPKDTWYVVLKGKVMYLYEDEGMTECEAAIELGGHDVVIYPEGLLDGELFTRRNAICLKPRSRSFEKSMPKEMPSGDGEQDDKTDGEREQDEKSGDAAQEEALAAPWFILVRSCVDMEDWYLALVHASDHPSGTPTLSPLKPVFVPSEMNHLVATLDEQPDVIPMRWFNALLGRLFYSFYKTEMLESYIISRLMKKLSKVKRPAFLTDIAVTQFSVGDKAPTFSKPMLKELTKEGDASLEVGLSYRGEIRATVEATAVINLGARFKSYTVKLVLAVVLRELDGNLLVKVKRPPSNRIWYAFTKPPRMIVNVEPIVSDRQITWSMILNTIESKIEEIIVDSVVLPHMDDISFSDSVEREHRGGIWADAVRSDEQVPASALEAVTKPSAPQVGSPLAEDAPATIVRACTEQEPAIEPPSPESIPIIRSVTTSSNRTSTTIRRSSWFSYGMDTELDREHLKEMEEEVVRGRKERCGGPNGNLTPPPHTPVTPPLEVSDNEQEPLEYLSPRPSSSHSHTGSRSSRAHSISSSAGGDESSNYLSDTSATSKSPRHSIGMATTSSFLSALKSKAGDKQALSNTAKEAMRKWGVWGLKKDAGGNPPTDDLPDVGPSDHSPRAEGTHGRQSYADMRAAVIERREREQSEKLNGGTSPVPIPQGNDREKGRSTSVSGSRTASYSDGSTSPGLSRSLGDNVSNDPFKDRDFTEAEEENPAPSLIHTQPSQGRTMTIPGIHASHRGEVMSMGNVARISPPPEGKPKGAAIQSMYRLWKSPILTGQQSQDAQLSSSTSPEHADANDRNHDVAPLSLTPEVTPPSRPAPPPLPPRTISSVAVRYATETADDPSVVSASAASQALKTIVSRDETRRLSTEISMPGDGESTQPATTVSTAVPTISPNSKPPLPPRRIPT